MKQSAKQPDWSEEIESWPAAWHEWGWLAGGAMILFGASEESLVPTLVQVRAAVEASGETPEALYGDPVAYGRTRGKALRPAGEILERTWVLGTLPGLIKSMVVALGGMLALLGSWLGIERGWQEPGFDGPVMLVFPLATALMGLAMWGWVQRTRGRLRSAWIAWAGTVAGCAGGTWLISSLPDDAIGAPANWSLVVIGAVLFAIGMLPPWPKSRGLVDDAGWDDERWFKTAENLLRGRYLFTRTQAVSALREARAHRALSNGGEPIDAEFGNVEVFAAYQAAAHAPAIRRGVRLRHVGRLAFLLGYGGLVLTPNILEDGLGWLTGPLAVILVVLLIWTVRELLPSKLDVAASEKTRERNADALALDPHTPLD